MSEIVVILVVALIFIGPKKLPEIARTLGKGMAEFRRASNDMRRAISEEIREADRTPDPPSPVAPVPPSASNPVSPAGKPPVG